MRNFSYFLDKLPFLEINVIYEEKSIRLFSLIDTGADYTIFPRWVADKLGVIVEEGKMKLLEGAGGNLLAYIHPLTISICDKEIKIDVCFSEKNDIPEHILGRKDILNNFKLILDKNHFELIEHEENGNI